MAMYCYVWLYRVMDSYYAFVGLCMGMYVRYGYMWLCRVMYG